MSKKALLLVALFVLVVFRVPAFAASPSSATFAHAWNVYSDKEKRSFLFGLATGARIMANKNKLIIGLVNRNIATVFCGFDLFCTQFGC